MNAKKKLIAIQECLKLGVDDVAELVTEIERLQRENEKLRLAVNASAATDIALIAYDWYQDPGTQSAWNRPCDSDYELRRVIKAALDKLPKPKP